MDDLSRNRDEAKAGLDANAVQILDQLAAENAGDLFASVARDGKIRMLSGKDLAPQCANVGEAFPRISEEWTFAKLHCFLDRVERVYSHNGTVVSRHGFSIDRVGPGMHPDEFFVSIRQAHAHLPIRPGVLNLFFIDNALVSATGDLYDGSLLPTRVPMPQAVLEAAAERIVRNPVVAERYFDAERGGFTVVFRGGGLDVILLEKQ